MNENSDTPDSGQPAPPTPATPCESAAPIQSAEPVVREDDRWKRLYSYHGDGGDLFKIFIINYVLSIITLGFYRFWGKTRIRRYVWSNVEIFNDRLEYTGTPKELLIGFMVVLFLILFPIFILPEIILTVTESENVELQAAIGGAQALLIYFLIPVALYRARRYRLSRTQWRGIRGGQTGKAWIYGVSTLFLYALAPFTMFLMLPHFRRKLSEYRIGHTWFGAAKLDFAPRTGPLFYAFVGAVLLYVAVVVILVLFLALMIALLPNTSWTTDKTFEDLLRTNFTDIVAVYMVVFAIIALALSTAPYNWYRAREWRYFATCINFKELRFRFDISPWGYMFFATGNNLLVLFTLGLATPYVYTRYIRYFEARLVYQGDAESQIIAQSTEEGPDRGEGLMDVFDVGGI